MPKLFLQARTLCLTGFYQTGSSVFAVTLRIAPEGAGTKREFSRSLFRVIWVSPFVINRFSRAHLLRDEPAFEAKRLYSHPAGTSVIAQKSTNHERRSVADAFRRCVSVLRVQGSSGVFFIAGIARIRRRRSMPLGEEKSIIKLT